MFYFAFFPSLLLDDECEDEDDEEDEDEDDEMHEMINVVPENVHNMPDVITTECEQHGKYWVA